MQITEHIHALRIPFQVFTPNGTLDRFVVVYLIVGETVWLIDAGVAGAEGPIASYLRGIGRDLSDLSTLVLTHAHPDHVGAARAIREATGCTVAAHPAERAWIEDVDRQARERPVPGFERLVGGSVPVHRLLAEGDVLEIGAGVNLEVLHTPGHSRGSISLFLPAEGALITGDAVPLPGDLPIFDSLSDSVATLHKLREVRPVRVLLSAWDEPRRDATACIDEGLAYLRRIRDAVCAARADTDTEDPLALCRRILPGIGLPPAMANPLVARSFTGPM